jgi:hypothetical protein
MTFQNKTYNKSNRGLPFSVMIVILFCFGCQSFKRKDGVQKVKIFEEKNFTGKIKSTLLYYQEYDKNDSLIYSEYYGPEHITAGKPIIITNNYFKDGKLIEKATSYAGETKKEIFVYSPFKMSGINDNNDTSHYIFNDKNRLVKEVTMKNGKPSSEKNYTYGASDLLPDITAYINGRIWYTLSSKCKNDTCMRFYKDSTGTIKDISVTVFQNGLKVSEFYNDYPRYDKFYDAGFLINRFNTKVFYKHNHNRRLSEIETLVNNVPYNKIIYKWSD